jgi:hypothetical protein
VKFFAAIEEVVVKEIGKFGRLVWVVYWVPIILCSFEIFLPRWGIKPLNNEMDIDEEALEWK